MQSLCFTGLQSAPAGTLAALLRQAYAPLVTADPARWEPEIPVWAAFDHEAFSNPAVGRCVFLSWLGDTLIGFGSFDPRGAPALARIGHHCIAPSHRHHGFGRRQFEELLRRLQARAAPRLIDAFTLDLPFFTPARRIYVAAGFVPIERTAWSKNTAIARLHYRRSLPPPS